MTKVSKMYSQTLNIFIRHYMKACTTIVSDVWMFKISDHCTLGLRACFVFLMNHLIFVNLFLYNSSCLDVTTFEKDFASGYLIGEVLHKYQLQDDFDKFSQSRLVDLLFQNMFTTSCYFEMIFLTNRERILKTYIFSF